MKYDFVIMVIGEQAKLKKQNIVLPLHLVIMVSDLEISLNITNYILGCTELMVSNYTISVTNTREATSFINIT